MDNVGKDLVAQIREEIRKGHSLRLVFDNFDFMVLVNVVTSQHKNSDIHWIGHYATFDRVPSDHLDDLHPPVPNIEHFVIVGLFIMHGHFDLSNRIYSCICTV